MDHSTLVRVAVAIAAVVFLDALFVEVRRAMREAKRLLARLDAYAQLPIFALFATCESDVERVTQALDALPGLIERADQAWLVVRSLGRVRPLQAADVYRPKGSFPD
jgi:hypothetical protein